jgi:hypothetical protein
MTLVMLSKPSFGEEAFYNEMKPAYAGFWENLLET